MLSVFLCADLWDKKRVDSATSLGHPQLKSRSLKPLLKTAWSCFFCYVRGLSIMLLSRSLARNYPMSFKYWTFSKRSPALINGVPISCVRWLQPWEKERQPLLAEGLSLTTPVLLWPRMGKTKNKPSYDVKQTDVGKEYCTWVLSDNTLE